MLKEYKFEVVKITGVSTLQRCLQIQRSKKYDTLQEY